MIRLQNGRLKENTSPVLFFEPGLPGSSFQESKEYQGIDLQWFAAEDEGRTEDPTDQKIKKAREDGKVAKSTEVVSALVLLLPMLAFAAAGNWWLSTFQEMIAYFLGMVGNFTSSKISSLTGAFFEYFIKLALPIMGIAFFAALLANLVQVGFLFSTKPIKPDLSKISPNVFKWLKRTLFSLEGFYNLMKSIFKIIIVFIAAFFTIRGRFPHFEMAINGTLESGFYYLMKTTVFLMIETAIIMLILSLPDYFFQRWQHRESLKMTKHEVKEEYKQMEGDPEVRGRLKRRMQEILSANMIQNVPKADVVITNPTHFAVALEWDNVAMMAPTVTAKGQDQTALRIRAIATENEVPLVENKPLARALYANVEIGDIIPEDYWEVVSVILAEIYRMNGKAV